MKIGPTIHFRPVFSAAGYNINNNNIIMAEMAVV